MTKNNKECADNLPILLELYLTQSHILTKYKRQTQDLYYIQIKTEQNESVLQLIYIYFNLNLTITVNYLIYWK